MNIPLPFITSVYTWTTIILFILGIFFLIRYSDIKAIKTRLKEQEDVSDDLRKRLDDKEKEGNSLQGQVNSLKEQVAGLNATLAEKDKRISTLEHVQVILPPEVLTYQQDVRNFMNQVHQYMIDSAKTLEQLKKR